MRWGRWSVGALVLGVACGGAIDTLAPHEQDRWQRCFRMVEVTQCTSTDNLTRVICMRQLGDRYAQEGSEADRQAFLVGHGCPSAMVGYASGDRSSGGSSAGAEPLGHIDDVNVDRTYNESLHTTTLTLTAHLPQFEFYLSGFPEHPGDDVTIRVSWTPHADQSAACRMVSVVGGTESLSVAEPRFSTTGVVLSVSGTIPLADVRRLADRTPFGVRLCNAGYRFSPTQVAGLANFLRSWDEVAAAAAQRERERDGGLRAAP